MSKKLIVGDIIPDFELENQDGKLIKISIKDEKKRIIYFYPKDDTKVCTQQACSFRDWQDELIDLGFEVIGISKDTPSSHSKFKAKHNLNFTLLSDSKGKISQLLGVSKIVGFLPARKTFLVDKKGKIVYIYEALFQGVGHIQKLKKFIKENKI